MYKTWIRIAAAMCALLVIVAAPCGILSHYTTAMSADSAVSDSVVITEFTENVPQDVPVVEDVLPVVVDVQPVAVEEQPVVEEEQPVVEEQQPVVEEEQPVVEEEQPVVEEQQPVVEEEQPVVEEEQPVVEEEQPVVEEEQPAVEEQPVVLPNVSEEDMLAQLEALLQQQMGQMNNLVPAVPSEPAEPSVPSDDNDEGPSAPAVAPLSIGLFANTTSAEKGDTISASVAISGGVAPYALSISLSLNDISLASHSTSLNPGEMHALSWVSQDPGNHVFSVSVTDASGASASASAAVAVRDRGAGLSDDSHWLNQLHNLSLSGDWRSDLILIAQSQLGYQESAKDYILHDGKSAGYTLYGEWAGNAYADWCAAFIGWCFEQANTGLDLRLAAVSSWLDKMNAYSAFRDPSYTPEPGDIIFIIPADSASIGHIGLVEYVSGSIIGTIEANVGDMVDRRTYAIGDAAIGGFASTSALMDACNVAYSDSANVYLLEDVPDFTGYLNTDETVNVRFGPSTSTMRAARISGKGTPLTVSAQVTIDDTLWFLVSCEDAYGTQSGYIMARFVDGSPEINDNLASLPSLEVEEDVKAPVVALHWEQDADAITLSCFLNQDVHVQWQRAPFAADLVWEDVPQANAPQLTLPTNHETCKYYYRCVAEAYISNPVILLSRQDIVEWLATTNATQEMYLRAVSTSSLDSLVLEDNLIIHVRSGQAVASYNPENGELRETDYNVLIGYLDPDSLAIIPLGDPQPDAPSPDADDPTLL